MKRLSTPPASGPRANRVAALAESTEPAYDRVPVACKVSGISQSHLYELLRSGEIKSSCIRRRGAARGVRLVNRESLLDFIRRHETTTTTAA